MYNLNKDLAEFYGILLGDGCISRYKNEGRIRTVIRIDGNSITDKEYYEYLKNLILKIADQKTKSRIRKDCNGIYIKFENKSFSEYLNRELDFPIGLKGNMQITEKLINNKDLICKVLRGFFDTDGCIYFTKNNSKKRYYPIIELSTHSTNLLLQLQDKLDELGFKTKISHYNDSIKLHGKNNIEKWIKEIGSSNPYKLNRYLMWKNNGFIFKDPNKKL